MSIDYLIYEDTIRRPDTKPVFDAIVAQIEAGTARVRKLSRAEGFKVDGQGVLGEAVLEYFLARQNAEGFDADAAQAFTDKMRKLLGWTSISYTLTSSWYEPTVRDPFLHDEAGGGWLSVARWALKPDADPARVNPAWLRFACWIAVGFMKYGMSFDSVNANAIFDQVTALGSDLPARLKAHGSGQLPADLVRHRDDTVSCVANDAFGTIRITLKDDAENSYRTALTLLCRLLEADFPRSYAIEFRSPASQYLPVKGLPKKGVHALFASAAGHPALWPLIERYARSAMREYEWYTNFDGENAAMPGTFAVFALALADDRYLPLALDYLHRCDGEHQSIHAKFLHAYLAAHGFTPNAIALLVACAGNIQHLEPIKAYASAIANRDSLAALAEARGAASQQAPSAIGRLKASLDGDRRVSEHVWKAVVHAIWGDAANRHPDQLIASAPDELQALYEAVLA
ncbi:MULTISPECIES: DUF6138 family protein [Burkholderia]|uniref:Uncharacterized protein n=1 Tax=Burkholderia aenigmatica TaxID=2015348 RepID=A0ABY6XUG8_9BURK|nr:MULTISPECIES: DUF6138 family protein [Burkholderia]VWC84166.1 hypothetical protein BLA17378_04127 [Burkholderia aenigmatica]VWD52117.1 hypothetical protein BLA18628_06153 [Burkholderia aenigmatica]